MKTLTVLGTLGAGKTTLINRLLRSGQVPDKTLVVVNDVGEINVDAKRLESASQLVALTAGCIGCGDLTRFRQVLAEAAAAAVDLLIIEPTGIADGREIRRAVEEAGEQWAAITLLDMAHLHRNLALGMLPTQLTVATIVGLTWSDGGLELPDEAADVIGEHCPNVPVVTIGEAGRLNLDLAELLYPPVPREQSQNGVFADHHDDYHDHVHGVFAVSLDLRPDLSWAEFMAALAPYQQALVRGKGVVAGQRFDLVHEDLRFGALDSGPAHANLISTQPLPDLQVGTQRHIEVEQLRKDLLVAEGHDRDATIEAIEWQLAQYPPVYAPDGSLRVDCEADVAYQLAKRPEVPRELYQEALRRYIRWRLSALEVFRVGEDLMSHPDAAYWRLRLGMVLSWHAAVKSQDLDPDQLHAIARSGSAEMAFRGLHGITALSFDEQRAEEKPEIMLEVALYGLYEQGLELDRIMAAMQHAAELSRERPEWRKRWLAAREGLVAAATTKEE